ncbi:hypothetical protein C8024_16405 [Sphingopyxis sp. BSNA05]|uniref:hypothetical protein n=1 Tax=Sphingopyxis sp. BSNA05 TaxID=1236614 RepID=UPI001564CD48|nr:hypothetical protein [Sphingopyxis sp. BSNA05]NRD90688.1 hypothetical protein [Sphingopyxis sp. BSNA05]
MRLLTIFAATLFFSQITGVPAFSQVFDDGDTLQYADLADLSSDASIIAHVTVKKAIKVDPERPQMHRLTRSVFI